MGKYIPSVTVPSDDFVVEDEDGNEYRPHEGEWVKFRTRLPFAVFKMVWGAVPDLDELEDKARIQLNIERGEDARRALAHQIVDWDWTDDDGEPHPRPGDDKEGFAEVLGWLSREESDYLIGKMIVPGEAPKNS
jgi:hypothetical protein